MRRVSSLAAPGSALILLVLCFGAVLFRDHQFAYRDAAHFYYPLYQRVQQEWAAGRLPLWEPEENAGQPLLGNPTAAVLYPGKLIFALAPSYAWGVRLYTIAHVGLAIVCMFLLMRSWGTSRAGSGIAALAYGFGAPILFQYCNIVFLVGAAWAPLAIRAVDRWLRLGSRWALGELAVILALQTLGGDPQAAYVEGLCAGGYAIGLAWSRREGRRSRPAWVYAAGVVAAVVVWSAIVLIAAKEFPEYRRPHKPPLPLPWMTYVDWGIRGVWLASGAALAYVFLRRPGRPLPAMLVGLLGAAALAATLAGAQLVPVLEFTNQTVRAAGSGPHDIYPFSLEPVRLLEYAFPEVFGTTFHGNRGWLAMVPPDHVPDIWVPSLYLGGPALVLALSAFGFRYGPPWRAWLAGIAVLSLLAALGKFGSPIWVGRCIPEVAAAIGPHDKELDPALRFDGYLRDGDGGAYWLMATVLPGFKEFRYPSKFLTFTCLALAGLAGLGWDRVISGLRGRATAWAGSLLALGIGGFAFALAARDQILRGFAQGRLWPVEGPEGSAGVAKVLDSGLGPFDPAGAWADLAWALGQGCLAFALTLGLVRLARGRRELAGALLTITLAADLALANSGLILTAPQSMFESKPEVLELIEKFERENPTEGGLYRVHRMPVWEPFAWRTTPSRHRPRDFVRWERKTLQPKYAIPYGLQYVFTEGTAELYDYMFFFAPFEGVGPTARKFAEETFGDPTRRPVAYARRAFDLWNTRYFILPFQLGNDEHRGILSFLYPGNEAEHLVPESVKDAPEGWAETEDWQLLRNRSAYPRAWVVHQAKVLKPIDGLRREDRVEWIYEILYQADPLWFEGTEDAPGRVIYDPRQLAWVESEDPGPIYAHLPGGKVGRDLRDRAEVTHYSPTRVELEVDLRIPGLVVLADAYYPGWRLTIDGKPAPIYRTNRMMRGALVDPGPHTLVYRYEPSSLRVGVTLSVLGLFALVAVGVWSYARPISEGLSAPDDPESIA